MTANLLPLSPSTLAAILDVMRKAALRAGDAILEEYAKSAAPRQKSDGSPVTDADQKAEAIIIENLRQCDLPILAEESVAAGHIPALGERYFVVDPLDGTKEFLKRNGEFTVNIALIENGYPVAGVLTAPALAKGYLGSPAGAFTFEARSDADDHMTKITVLDGEGIALLTSRSHRSHATSSLFDQLPITEECHIGSSLKFALIAEGKANLYPRMTPTCEWDIAAGQAILEAAGGTVLALDGQRLAYGKNDARFLNSWFAAGSSEQICRTAIALMQGAAAAAT